MRRQGASHVSKKPRVDVATKTYSTARRKLNELLKSFSFVKVSELTNSEAKNGRPEFYHGVGITVKNSKFENSTERVFFDKGGRLRNRALLEIGPCKLVDAAWGREHISAVPQVGDILVGVLEPNPRQGKKIAKVLKSWSRHGKIVMELSRMVEFGTGVSEIDVGQLLRQAECAMAQLKSFLSVPNAADDFWMLARIVLWGNLRPLAVLHSIESGAVCKQEPSEIEVASSKDLKLSSKAYDFVSLLAFRLEDPSILTDFVDLLDIKDEPLPLPPANLPIFSFPSPLGQNSIHDDAVTSNTNPAPSSPIYFPTSPVYAKSPSIQAPSSPAYFPTSPQLPKSPVYAPTSSAPSSPVYAPISPAPSSPVYAPITASSPVYFSTNLALPAFASLPALPASLPAPLPVLPAKTAQELAPFDSVRSHQPYEAPNMAPGPRGSAFSQVYSPTSPPRSSILYSPSRHWKD